jgi:predicted exporter
VTRAARWALGAWLALLVACGLVIARTQFTTDLSAFLPRSPSPVQQLLVEQLRDGVASRLMLIGIEGAPPERLAEASKRLGAALRASGAFAAVNNGEPAGYEKDRELLWQYRYLLSPAVRAEHFSPQGLHASLNELLGQLASSAGVLAQRMASADPSGELLRLVEQLAPQARPRTQAGVWFSRDATRALLVAQTAAPGSDIDAQQRALSLVRASFAEAAGSEAKLVVTGPGVFSVASREHVREDAWRLSLAGSVLIGALLIALYRSMRVLGLGFLPVASGALAGIAAVSLAFGSVHGITIAFGVTLIGEAVDYAIYLFTQNAPDAAPETTFARIWPTLRLGMLTSICGFSAMLLSNFTGLAQLGLFSIAGLLVAGAVTRWVLPPLVPRGFSVAAVAALVPGTTAALRRAPRLRVPLFVLLAAALVFLVARPQPLWSSSLASVNPVSAAEQALDRQLREDVGAPDVSYLVVIGAPDQEAALQASERAAAALRDGVARGWLQGFDHPAAYLPSLATQRARQRALPPAEVLRGNLQAAQKGLPFRPAAFEPFVRDISASAELPLLERASLRGTSLGLRLDALLVQRGAGWTAMLPLRGVSDANAIAARLSDLPGATMLDLKRQFDELYRSYLREALLHSLLGAAAIALLLFLSLRSPRRVLDVAAPLAAAALATCGLLALAGVELSIFHLIGLVLVVAVGSNYSLFFDRQAPASQERGRTVVSLLFAALTTVIGFGLLALSQVPVLSAIGTTVGLGASMALVFSAIMSRPDNHAS